MTQEEYISLAAGGDEEAFAVLVRDTEALVYNICLKIVLDREDALDLSQESYLKAWHALPLYKGESSFRTWMGRIATNTCLDFLRKKNRKRKLSVVSLDADLSLTVGSDEFDPHQVLVRSMEQEALQEAILQLPENDRAILTLRGSEELNYQEIAEIMELPVGTVKSRISRARGKILRLLNGNQTDPLSSNKVKGGEET